MQNAVLAEGEDEYRLEDFDEGGRLAEGFANVTEAANNFNIALVWLSNICFSLFFNNILILL